MDAALSLILGTRGDDRLVGSLNDDMIYGFSGRDSLAGGLGADTLLGGGGDDVLVGGQGDDRLLGGRGADRFVFDPSDLNLGDDVIGDFSVAEGDAIVLNAADIFRSDQDILGSDQAFQATDLDTAGSYDLVASPGGFLTVLHPGGTITVRGVPFSPDLTFGALAGLGAVAITGLIADPNEAGLLVSQSGDDLLVGTNGAADSFLFDPSNPQLGDDIIANFEVGSDQIVLNAADVLRSAPDILGEDGVLSPEDFDQSDAFDLAASERGNLTVLHPGGTIEIAGVPFSEEFTFASLAELGAIGLSGLITPVALSETDVLLNARAFLPPDFPVLVSGVNDDLILADAAMTAPDLAFFDISQRGLGDDILANFDVTQDLVVFDAADLFRALGNGSLSDDGAITASDLDESEAFDLIESDRGNLTIVHPNGSIELLDIPFLDGLDFSFVAQNVLGLAGFVTPDADGVTPSGSGDEFLQGVSGLAQAFVFDPSNPQLGDDVIGELIVGEDQIVLDLDGVLAVDPHIAGPDGVLTAEDFDASDAFDLAASDRGNLTVLHPGGTIEIANFAFSEDLTFAALADAGALAVQDFGDEATVQTGAAEPALASSAIEASWDDMFVLL
ncbi:MAG: calcium-binding protein [Alphaproteobacteria bacterium]